ncbi:cupin domain-containing protein [Streptomyces sp. RS2]|uniref:cupin domain-containing protein n=1 Tax=Streptomyces sp. RS2 TaxID=1451205 RepID=UPI0021F8B5AF|nr:cupin domain-containing protein [Streptomyces sp. RS2]MCW1100118.1 cupin domain-containing protein [Streptomyces sp. RS2]
MVDGIRNLNEAFNSFTDPWQPRRLTSVNNYDVKVAKFLGEFDWHSHPDTDELFLVIEGRITIQLRTGDVELGPQDVYVVPRGIDHCPKADHEASVVLFELKGTVNTGSAAAESPLTAALQELGQDRTRRAR